MARRKKLDDATLKQLRAGFREIDRRGGSGAFGIESKALNRAKEIQLQLIREDIAALDRGYEGNTRRCPRCGKETQRYKGDVERTIEFECGEITFSRSYYVCCECGASSYPLDEQLRLAEGKEQGYLREKLSMLAVLTSYHQAPQVCRTMLGREEHASTLRRLLLREAKEFDDSIEKHEVSLPPAAGQKVYVQIDGHMCPTREERQTPQDQGFREAKAVIAYREGDVVQVTEKRKELLRRILKAKVTNAEEFLPIVRKVCQQANTQEASTVVVLADGAKWIWNLVEEVIPGATQILDFAHAKGYLYDFAKIRFAHEPARIVPWVKEQEDRLCNDRVWDLIGEMKSYADLNEELAKIGCYFESNAKRMFYGTYKAQGLTIGSGAIESAGKQLAVSRIKGAGMRWNVCDLNPLLTMRAAFLDGSWDSYWQSQGRLAA